MRIYFSGATLGSSASGYIKAELRTPFVTLACLTQTLR
jgi:hypothetical protein